MPLGTKGLQGLVNGWVNANNKHVVFPGEEEASNTTPASNQHPHPHPHPHPHQHQSAHHQPLPGNSGGNLTHHHHHQQQQQQQQQQRQQREIPSALHQQQYGGHSKSPGSNVVHAQQQPPPPVIIGDGRTILASRNSTNPKAFYGENQSRGGSSTIDSNVTLSTTSNTLDPSVRSGIPIANNANSTNNNNPAPQNASYRSSSGGKLKKTNSHSDLLIMSAAKNQEKKVKAMKMKARQQQQQTRFKDDVEQSYHISGGGVGGAASSVHHTVGNSSTSGDTKSSGRTLQVDNSSAMMGVSGTVNSGGSGGAYPPQRYPHNQRGLGVGVPSSVVGGAPTTSFQPQPNFPGGGGGPAAPNYYMVQPPPMPANTGQYINEAAFSNHHKNHQQQRTSSNHKNIKTQPSIDETRPMEEKGKRRKSVRRPKKPSSSSSSSSSKGKKTTDVATNVLQQSGGDPVGSSSSQTMSNNNSSNNNNSGMLNYYRPDLPPNYQEQHLLTSTGSTVNPHMPIINNGPLHPSSGPVQAVGPIPPQNPHHNMHHPAPSTMLHKHPGPVISESASFPKDCPCPKCIETGNRLLELEVDLEYLRSMAMQNEFVCMECENNSLTSGGGGGGRSSLHHVSSSVSLSSKHSMSSKKSMRSRRSNRSSRAQHEPLALAEASQRLIDVTKRHKRQIENMTKETARCQNDMHLKLSKLAMMCSGLNDESAKRKEESNVAKNELESIRNDRNTISSELEILQARVKLYEKQEIENSEIRNLLRQQENELLDAADEAIQERDNIIQNLTEQLRQTKDTLDFERKLQNQRRQIIFPNQKSHSHNNDNSPFFTKDDDGPGGLEKKP